MAQPWHHRTLVLQTDFVALGVFAAYRRSSTVLGTYHQRDFPRLDLTFDIAESQRGKRRNANARLPRALRRDVKMVFITFGFCPLLRGNAQRVIVFDRPVPFQQIENSVLDRPIPSVAKRAQEKRTLRYEPAAFQTLHGQNLALGL